MDWVEPDEIMDGDAAVGRHKKRIANLSDGDKAIWKRASNGASATTKSGLNSRSMRSAKSLIHIGGH